MNTAQDPESSFPATSDLAWMLQEWAIEELKLDSARNFKGICSVDLDDEEFQDIIKNVRRKLERHMAAAMQSKRKPWATCSRVTGALNITNANASENIPKKKFNCIVEAHESTRPRMESSTTKDHEEHIAGTGKIRCRIANWCTSSFQCCK